MKKEKKEIKVSVGRHCRVGKVPIQLQSGDGVPVAPQNATQKAARGVSVHKLLRRL